MPSTLRARLSRQIQHLRYRLLFARHARCLVLDRALFAGRSVLVMGPARTLEEDLAALDPGGFDLVIRMNNGLHLPVAALGATPWRCDVLFHSLSDDTAPVTPESLARAGVRVLVHRTPGRSYIPRTLEAERRLAPLQVRIIPPADYSGLAAGLGGASPTTGLVVLNFLLGCDTARLAVAGFTFFTTRYAPGYDDRDRADADSLARVRAAGHHDPEAELRLLARAFSMARASGRDLRLGPHVEAALDRADP
jgi:hypothetical protein